MAPVFAAALVAWFDREARDYPWRRTTDPWAILVSEVMLQQTTIPTVLGRYEAWMRRFPTPQALATASEEEALRSWEGLGYYRRVRSLQAAARAMVARHGGCFPEEPRAIRALPGIGDYTAAAVLSFAFNLPAPLVDANVARVLARVFDDAAPVDAPEGRRRQWALAARLVSPDRARTYNAALMELGQRICTGGQPDCLLCPVRAFCATHHPEQLPMKLPKPELLRAEHCDLWALTPEGLLMERQPSGVRHAGMLRLPRRSEAEVAGLEHLLDQRYSVTRYRVLRRVFRAAPGEQPRERELFVPLARLESEPMASPDRKVVLRLLAQG
ncbi:MAG: A/G-specific adenine glycosylase [Akkermansia sp.]